jgi:outer membrane protein OmpA-like peptidoglycan-associated protein
MKIGTTRSSVRAALALAATSAVAELLLAAAASRAGAAEPDTATPVTAAPTKASKPETAGVVTGLAVGAAAGGPIGAIVGAAAGAWIGDRYHRKDEERRALKVRLEAEDQATRELETTVLFRTGGTTLRDDTVAQLSQLGASLAMRPEARVRVAGFADARGSEASNLELSKRRALAVAAVLEAAGVSADRVIIEAHGKTLAMAAPSDLEGDAFERRVTVSLEPGVATLARAQ